jgi:hypothetical protein
MAKIYNIPPEYIDSITDIYIKQIFVERFINHKSWVAVADRIGGGNTPDNVRQAYARYIKKHPIELK